MLPCAGVSERKNKMCGRDFIDYFRRWSMLGCANWIFWVHRRSRVSLRVLSRLLRGLSHRWLRDGCQIANSTAYRWSIHPSESAAIIINAIRSNRRWRYDSRTHCNLSVDFFVFCYSQFSERSSQDETMQVCWALTKCCSFEWCWICQTECTHIVADEP